MKRTKNLILMRFSRNKLSKTGETLLTSKNKDEVSDAQTLINKWRTDHLVPLEILKEEITILLKDAKISQTLISQRLKRLSSIKTN